MFDDRKVVIDNGTGYMKAGFSSDTKPIVVFQSIVGKNNYQHMVGPPFLPEYYVGDDAISKKGVLSLKYPVEDAIIRDWNGMKHIWEHTYSELRIDHTEYPVLLTEAPKNPLANREKMAELFFDEFQVPGLYVAIQAVLALYSTGRVTGTILDSGDGVTHIVPTWEGHSLKHAIKRIN